ncbi:HNH endonuclease signature motif containing protein [Saccharopolyspora pogona]|uniref:HNH endonuclease signature motif containing protein n=1 Tax=Saccharopolyspora pogona TaxID=333966 RepID=UPI0016822F97|nr:HNH endonuclease signature motif containing protein [Saccharopolyspora pogona]
MTPLLNIQDPAVGTTSARSAVSCTDAELAARIRELEEGMRVLMMEQLQCIAEADHRGGYAELGFRSAQVWLQGLLNIDARDAKTRVKVARNVEDRQSLYGEVMPADLPETAAALAEGAIGLEHARVIVDGVRRLPEYARCHQVGEVESTLAGYARMMTPRELEKLAERIRYLLDQDGAYDDEEDQHESRELHYTVARDGMTVIKARLDREAGAKFAALMQPLAAPRPEVEGEKDPRTVGQRNADGFAAILDLALDHDGVPRSGGQRPHITISIDFEDLKRGLGFVAAETGLPGTLNTERAITAENARRIACDAEVLPMVLGGDGLPLEVGRAKRTAPTHLRAALLQRDGVCAFPGCDRPPGTPEAHHIAHWVDGGSTELGNMVMLCGHHHRTLHNQRWETEIRDRRPVFIPPSTVDPKRTPRPGGRALPTQHREYLRDLIPTQRGPAGEP